MPPVRKLSESLIGRIAAGEAVERPASVAKELLENSLDAGATSVEVAIAGGGRRAIRVADDGCGMGPEDARLALERHATSKISTADDLLDIRTLGFRGEALPAIGAVSRLSLRTAVDDAGGFRVDAEGGAIRREQPEPHPRGTTVEVRDLFYNTPARAKFLRTVPTELARITEVVQAAALARPEVRFRLTHDDREILSAPPASGLEARIRQIFGPELAEALQPVEWGRAPLAARGFISRPAHSRASRARQFLFVNGRLVSDRMLSHAVVEACRPFFPRDRFPALFFFLDLPPSEVDVNVHPAKREVRFRTPAAIHDLARKAVEGALSGDPPVQEVTRSTDAARTGAVTEAVGAYLARAEASPSTARPGSRETGAGRREVRELPGTPPSLRPGGQLRDAYILVDEAAGLLLVDQHAAHERLLYDRYREQMRRGDVPVQSLLFPATVEVPASIAVQADRMIGEINSLGFAVEPFGRESLVVREVPALVADADPARLLVDLLEGMEEVPAGRPLEGLEHRLAALSACHAAVRAGMRLGPDRMQQLVLELLTGDHPLTCPHGRPATLRYPLREIERAFLRP